MRVGYLPMQHPRDLGWVLVSSVLAAACARAAAPAPQTQYSSPPPELMTNDVGQLERDLDQNEQLVLAGLGRAAPSSGAADQSKAEEGAAPPAAAGAAKEKAPSRAAPQAAPAAPAPPAPTPCADACRAFGSMQRSAARICELTANDQEHCGRARERVRAAETRIAQAGCVCPPRSD
jgi:hypothetical protein